MYKIDEKIRKASIHLIEACKEIADFLTDNPETGGKEKLACAKIVDFLRKQGYEVITPYCGVANSFLAVHCDRLEYSGPKAVMMCEYDALPEVGHACGHSISCGASLLGGLAIHMAYPDLPVRIDIMGTPGEEYPGGKVFLTNAGAFDGYEFAAMSHMDSSTAPTFFTLACTDRQIIFNGKSAHASSAPWDGCNALNAARIFMDALDMWRQHLPQTSQIHGIVESGGQLPSIVPDKVTLSYYFRAKNLKELNDLIAKAEKCAEGAALCTGTTYTMVQQYETYDDFYETDEQIILVSEILDALGIEWALDRTPSGSTDAGNVSYVLPTFQSLMNATGQVPAILHSPEFTALMREAPAYKAMSSAGILLACIAARLALEPGKLDEIKRSHNAYNVNRK